MADTKITLTKAETDFVLWTLGYVYGSKDELGDAHKKYIEEHHWTILPKLAGTETAKESLPNY